MTAPTVYCNECGASNPLQATLCFACDNPLHPLVSSSTVQHQVVPINAVVPMRTAMGTLAPSYLLHSRYNIVSQVGIGGFGAVYQAKDTLFGNRLVAIKEMSQNGLNPRELAEATAAFEREALILADLIHPNLPRIHDHFTENGCSYVVMDFIAGDTLEDYLGKVVRQLPVEDALEIGIQLCTVLDYLHTQPPPIIFRDLKPTNIMRTVDNHVYLIDFGIARHFQPGKAKDTIPLGSRGYAAPEQYGKAQSTPQSDIYGLGATLHELLTGDDPSLTPFHFAYVYVPGSPISAQLNALLKRMLEMEMSKRPTTMAIVKQELQSFVTQLAVQRPSLVQLTSQRKLRRRSFLVGLVSVVAICGGSSAITAFVFEVGNKVPGTSAAIHPLIGNTPSSSSPTQVLAPTNATILNTSLYMYYGNAGAVTAVAWAPHGESIASVGTLDSSVQVWDAQTGNIILIPGLDVDSEEQKLPSRKVINAISGLFETNNRRVDALAWSPDSTRIAAALDNDTVNVWSIETGNELVYSSSQPGTANALAWSPNGSSIASVSGNTAVQLWHVPTGKPYFTYRWHSQTILALAWSPDGKYIASGGGDGIVQVWNALTGVRQVNYSRHVGAVNAVSWSPDSKYIASGGADSVVRVWDATTGETLFTYHGHTDSVNAVAWQREPKSLSGKATRIASGGADTTVQVWSFGLSRNAKGREEGFLQGKILLYHGHSAQVTSLAWASDGKRIASSSEDGTVQLWRAM